MFESKLGPLVFNMISEPAPWGVGSIFALLFSTCLVVTPRVRECVENIKSPIFSGFPWVVQFINHKYLSFLKAYFESELGPLVGPLVFQQPYYVFNLLVKLGVRMLLVQKDSIYICS